jgi:hypothetical protein
MNPIHACQKQILDIIGALYVLGAESEATLLETDLYVAGYDLRELLIIRDFAEETLCANSDQT